MGVITLNNLTLAYQRHPAVHHLDAKFDWGSLTAIVGPNGSGKSTLVKAIAGAVKPTEGSISLNSIRQKDIAYLPQQSLIDRSFPILVYDLVASGAWKHIGPFGRVNAKIHDLILNALEKVGLSGFGDRIVSNLSGGQFQRTMFARLLVQDAPVVLLDEPFNAIDEKTAHDLLELISKWHGEKRTIITVLHDMDHVRDYFPRTMILARELIDYGDTHTVLTSENLRKARKLCEAFDENAPICDRKVA